MLVNFKVALATKGERQVDLAQRCGIDPTHLSQVINERREASAELRAKLSDALQVSEKWLFTRRKRGHQLPVPTKPIKETTDTQDGRLAETGTAQGIAQPLPVR